MPGQPVHPSVEAAQVAELGLCLCVFSTAVSCSAWSSTLNSSYEAKAPDDFLVILYHPSCTASYWIVIPFWTSLGNSLVIYIPISLSHPFH